MRVLVVRLDRIGDAVMTEPALRALRELSPGTEITVAMAAAPASLFEGTLLTDRLIALSDTSYGSIVRTALSLGRFELALNFVADYRGSLLIRLCGRERLGRGRWLTRRAAERPGRHEVERNLDVVRLLKPVAEGMVPELDATPGERIKAERLLARCGVGERPLPVHIGASPQWPEKHWQSREAARLLDGAAMIGYSPVLVGGKEDSELAAETLTLTGREYPNLAGKTSLRDLLAIYSFAGIAVGTDSGPQHIAAAAGARTVTLFGPADPERFRPLGRAESHRVVRYETGHPPCNVPGGCDYLPQRCECMFGITAGMVLTELEAAY